MKQEYVPRILYEIQVAVKHRLIGAIEWFNAAKALADGFADSKVWGIMDRADKGNPEIIYNEKTCCKEMKFSMLAELHCNKPEILPESYDAYNFYGVSELDRILSKFYKYRMIGTDTLKDVAITSDYSENIRYQFKADHAENKRVTRADIALNIPMERFSIGSNEPTYAGYIDKKKGQIVKTESKKLLEDALEEIDCKLLDITQFSPRMGYKDGCTYACLVKVVEVEHPENNTLKNLLESKFGNEMSHFWII